MSNAPNAFTIGNRESYDSALARPRPIYKLGRGKGYDGGWVWRTRQEAESFLTNDLDGVLQLDNGNIVGAAIYGLVLPNGWETDVSPEPHPEDGVHRLLVDAVILHCSEQAAFE